MFVPGWGAPAALYTTALPERWFALEPPSFAASRGSLAAYRRWLALELRRSGRSALGGHSMGAALSILVASEWPELVERLVLVAPAGLPITKPTRASLADFARQASLGLYPLRSATSAIAAVARAPWAAHVLAREVRRLDLQGECAKIRAARIPSIVIGCTTDTLVPCGNARRLASLLGAEYQELDLAGGHMWMLRDRLRFAGVFS